LSSKLKVHSGRSYGIESFSDLFACNSPFEYVSAWTEQLGIAVYADRDVSISVCRKPDKITTIHLSLEHFVAVLKELGIKVLLEGD